MENEQAIRHRMEKTRESLIDKIETLENKVMDSMQNATSAVTETVANVKETMHEGVETVKDAVDVKAHVERHPWLMLGGSVVCGYAIANLLIPGKGASPPAAEPQREPGRRSAFPPGNGRAEPAAPPTTPNWLSALQPEFEKLKALALGATLGAVREMLAEEVPPHMAEQLRTIIDGVTEKLGAETIPSSDFAACKSPTAACDPATQGAAFDPEKPRW